jgi:hypothetical protein
VERAARAIDIFAQAAKRLRARNGRCHSTGDERLNPLRDE